MKFFAFPSKLSQTTYRFFFLFLFLSLSSSSSSLPPSSSSHIKEHMADLGEKIENISEEDEELYLFSLHDLDGDGFVDGYELRVSFSEHDEGASLKELESQVDQLLEQYDDDNDGRLSLEEYLNSEQ